MATYSPEQLGIKPPAGGFQTGGWYSSRQYWGGTLGEPGVIHPSSSQQGAGQAVSTEVLRAGSIAAGLEPTAYETYIASERAKISNQGQVAPYLSQFQDQTFQGMQAPEIRIPTMEELKKELAPSVPYPEPLKRIEEFEKMRTTYGVTDLEKSLIDIKAQVEEEQALLRTQRATEEGKLVPMNVIAGRISEEERVAQERIDFLGRQQSRVTDELNTKYNVISTYMSLMNLDYADAVSRYETEFENNVKIYDLISGIRREARSAYESDRDAARANLQIYMNAVTSGNADYSSLSADQRLMINKLEAQSGLPIGFMSTIRKDPDADIIFTSSNEGVTQVGIRNPDGTISVQSYGTRISGGGGTAGERTAERQRLAYAEANSRLSELGGEDLYVSPDEWQYVRSAWGQQGYDVDDFDDAFRDRFVGIPEERDWSIQQFGLE